MRGKGRNSSWVCGVRWGWCAKAAQDKNRHKCVTAAYAAKDHDHKCKYCGATKKNT